MEVDYAQSRTFASSNVLLQYSTFGVKFSGDSDQNDESFVFLFRFLYICLHVINLYLLRVSITQTILGHFCCSAWTRGHVLCRLLAVVVLP